MFRDRGQTSSFDFQAAMLLVGAVLFAAILIGCGGSSSSAEGTTSSDSSQPPPEPTESSEVSSGEGTSAEFLGPGVNGKLATLGEEADTAEREAASAVLEESLTAREDRDWTGQCSTLSSSAVKAVEKSSTLGGTCAQILGSNAEKAAQPALQNTMTGPIDVLRIQGDQGLAFYHGTNETDYVMPLERENGEWRVASLTTQEVP